MGATGVMLSAGCWQCLATRKTPGPTGWLIPLSVAGEGGKGRAGTGTVIPETGRLVTKLSGGARPNQPCTPTITQETIFAKG